jgi:glycosyltransferase involved in cell wall biosynthesis
MEGISTENRNEKRELNEDEKLERAIQYWESRLEGEERILVSQSPNCKFCIVVPVHGEQIVRVQKQLDSLQKQTVDSSQFEVIYVVNNDVVSNNTEKEEVFRLNKKAIDFIRSVVNFPVFVMDKSSTGHEISGCNVGKARNRGVAEASKRFYENGKNGILIQTDADAYFEDPDYLKKVLAAFEEVPGTIGVAGGLVFELDPDTQDSEKRVELEEKMERFILIKKWDVLNRFLDKGERYSPFQNDTFSGANMISKSFETAVIGGLVDEASGEDPKFGRDLKDYAEQNQGKVIGMKEELKVVTALRDSDRTPSSFKKVFDQIDLSKPLEVNGQIITPEIIAEYEKRVLENEKGKELLENMEKRIQELRVANK